MRHDGKKIGTTRQPDSSVVWHKRTKRITSVYSLLSDEPRRRREPSDLQSLTEAQLPDGDVLIEFCDKRDGFRVAGKEKHLVAFS